MAYLPLTILPGVFTDVTEFTAEGRYRRSNRIRWRDGLAEPIGGWQKMLATAMTGVPRALLAWSELDGTRDIAVGTDQKLTLIQGGDIFNITPVRDSGTLGTDPFTTTNGSAVVSVADTAHGLVVGSYVTFDGGTAVGGITIDGEYTVTEVTSDDAYTITHSAAATSAASGGGSAVTYSYEINIGRSNAIGGYGWGAGTWGLSTWGTPRGTTNVTLGLRLWSLLNWGEDLLASPRGDQLYQWDASNGTSTAAAIVSASPTAEFYVISPDDEHVIALGAGGAPLKVQWCDQSDFTNWTVSASTTAGSRTLRHGSKIIGHKLTKSIILIWTDKALFGLRYIGPPFTFELRTLALRNVVIGPFASVEFGDIVWWMADGGFYAYDGRVAEVPCSVLRFVFDDFDRSQRDKVACGVNEKDQEIWWFYPSTTGGGENDRYVKYKVSEKLWDVGELGRTAWIDRGLFDTPIAADEDGYLYEHEVGYLADGEALGEYLETGEFDVSNSNRLMMVKNMIPDILLEDGGSVAITFFGRKYPRQQQITKGPFTVTDETTKISPRLRARRASLKIAGDTPGTFWRTGRPVVDVIAKGNR